MNETVSPDRSHLMIGSAVVTAAALSAIWAPTNLVVILALVVLMRICWLEDNISNDLIGRDRLPGAYVNTAIRRGNLMRQWLGLEPAEDTSKLPPDHLATAMRAEIQVWGSMILGMSATLVVQTGPFGITGNLVLGGTLFWMALRRVDRLTVSLAHCAVGRALPPQLLLPTHRRMSEDRE